MEIMYKAPSEKDIEAVEVTKDVITRHAEPKVIRKKDKKESSKAQVGANDN